MRKTTLAGGVLGSSIVALALSGGCSSGSGKSGPSDAGSDRTTSSASGGSSGGSGGSSSGVVTGTMNPPPPALGTPIDRMGRAAVDTALVGTFDPSCTQTSCPAKDTYDGDGNPSHWATYVPGFAAYLGIYDGLDGTCGNQPAYGTPPGSGYATLAGLLADDVLWVNTANATCAQYLGVELASLGVSNADCGGRAPNENTIDLTYNVLAGSIAFATLPANPGPITNGVTAPASPATTTFPYLAPPH